MNADAGHTRVHGDRYAGEWPREQFRKHGINYIPSDKSKSDLYVDSLPLINSRAADLLDNERLVAQLTGLERRTSRGGKDSIDHTPGGHDDLANAAAGALVLASRSAQFQRRTEPPRVLLGYQKHKNRRHRPSYTPRREWGTAADVR